MPENFTLPKKTKQYFYSISEFQITKNMGSGAFSTVYEALHIASQHLYAIKMINLKKINSMDHINILKEIEVHSSLKHKNIIKLYDYFLEDNIVYYVLELCKKGNLFKYLNRKGQLLESEVIKFFKQTCEAIEYMHSLNFINRDIKPENIVLDDNYNVKLCDFGWSCHMNDEKHRQSRAGTYAYMSPECLIGSYQDKKSDVWSLGILLYELFYNKEPYTGISWSDQLRKIRQTPIDFNKRRICSKAKMMITHMIQQDKNKRPTVREILESSFLKELEQFFTQKSYKNQFTDSIKTPQNIIVSRKPQGVSNISNYDLRDNFSQRIQKKMPDYEQYEPSSKNNIYESKKISYDKINKTRRIILFSDNKATKYSSIEKNICNYSHLLNNTSINSYRTIGKCIQKNDSNTSTCYSSKINTFRDIPIIKKNNNSNFDFKSHNIISSTKPIKPNEIKTYHAFTPGNNKVFKTRYNPYSLFL